MPTRTGGSSANQSLKSDLSSGNANFQKNLDYMNERYGLNTNRPNDPMVDFVNSVDVSAGGNIPRNPSLYAKAITRVIEDEMKDLKGSKSITGEPDVGSVVKGVYRKESIYELAQRLAMKVVTETFNTVGGGQEPDSPFAIAKQTPNGVRVDPMQMKNDITGLFMQYAATKAVVSQYGYRDAEEEQNSPRGFVDATLSRFGNEIRAYGQYGKGEFCDIFDKAIVAFKDGLEKDKQLS